MTPFLWFLVACAVIGSIVFTIALCKVAADPQSVDCRTAPPTTRTFPPGDPTYFLKHLQAEEATDALFDTSAPAMAMRYGCRARILMAFAKACPDDQQLARFYTNQAAGAARIAASYAFMASPYLDPHPEMALEAIVRNVEPVPYKVVALPKFTAGRIH